MRPIARRASAIRFLMFATCLSALGACKDSAQAPEPQGPQPSPAAAEDFATLGAVGMVATSTLPQSQGNATPCAFDAVSGRHVCAPSRTPDGMTFTRSWGYRDGEGNAQERFDPALTASVSSQTELTGTAPGTAQGTTYVRTVNAHTSSTTSGLAGTETTRRVDGVRGATVVIDVTSGAEPRHESRILADTTSGLVFALAGDARWPIAGRTVRAWTNTVTAGTGETKVYFFREVVTFDGTRIAIAEISTDRGVWRCERDLEARTSRCTRS